MRRSAAERGARAADHTGVLIGACLLLALVAVPLTGGRLERLADLRLRWIPLATAAFAIQILIVNVIPEGDEGLRSAIHIATYGVLGVVLVRNLDQPGLPLIALGGLSNALAIVANGGVMPASEGALRTAGMTADPEAFTNSALVEDAHLWFLGDVFAVPSWVPGGQRLQRRRPAPHRGRLGARAPRLRHAAAAAAAPHRARARPLRPRRAWSRRSRRRRARSSRSSTAPRCGPRRGSRSRPRRSSSRAGRARSPLGGPSRPARAEVRDRRGRPWTLTASCFDAGDGTRLRTALAISA